MLNLKNAKNIVIVGGGTAGWFAALTLRRVFSKGVNVRLIESSKIGIVGVGEGGILNIMTALKRNQIDLGDFMEETGAAYKWGFAYEGWRTGAQDDKYYHLFGLFGHKVHEQRNGYYPHLCAMINQKIPLHSYMRGFDAIKNNASQAQAKELLASKSTDIVSSIHFDSHRVANYLKKTALQRGVLHVDAKVLDAVLDGTGSVTEIVTTEGNFPADLVIDASGLTRLIIGKMGVQWESFSDYLLMDRAIPFYMKHPEPNPSLVTRAIAMKAGWMWQIPLVHRVGAGYVYSSKFTTPEAAIEEIKAMVGNDVEPQRVISFEPGCYHRVWVGNVVALGLSSGFVEPLEATSIGQMLEQLSKLEQTLLMTYGVVPQQTIDQFNESNLASWLGVRDFLRMHYDNTRQDNAFWQAASQAPYPESYRQLRECWQLRTPRDIDISQYHPYGWSQLFHVLSWMYVGGAMGVIPPQATQDELLALPADQQLQLQQFVAGFRPKIQ